MLTLLDQAIVEQFGSKTVSVRQIEEFVLASTPFREAHYKKRLAALEKQGTIIPVNPPSSRRPATYPDPSLKLSFK